MTGPCNHGWGIGRYWRRHFGVKEVAYIPDYNETPTKHDPTDPTDSPSLPPGILSLAQLSKNLLDEKPKPDPTSTSWPSFHDQIELAPVRHLSARLAMLGNV